MSISLEELHGELHVVLYAAEDPRRFVVLDAVARYEQAGIVVEIVVVVVVVRVSFVVVGPTVFVEVNGPLAPMGSRAVLRRLTVLRLHYVGWRPVSDHHRGVGATLTGFRKALPQWPVRSFDRQRQALCPVRPAFSGLGNRAGRRGQFGGLGDRRFSPSP